MALFVNGDNVKNIIIYFVQDGTSSSKEMRNAFTICQEAKFNPKIIPEDSIEDGVEFNSNVVFVVESFIGETFNFLSSKECLVVGPSCISSCVSERIPIPHNGSPVFNISLRGIVISTSQLDSTDIKEIRRLAGFMGAVYSDDLTLAVTHLVVEKITSLKKGKCIKAIENNIPLIQPAWIRKSWEAAQMSSKPPTPASYKLPPFQGMHISCSNLTHEVKKKLQILIESNGGIYQRTLELNKTVVLVIGNPEGKKWQFAQQWGIPCVSPTWVFESAEKGCMAPSKDHLIIPRPKCSTPTNSAENNSFMSCSDISVVPVSSEKSNIDETNFSIASDLSEQFEIRHRPQSKRVEGCYKKLLEEVNLSDAKGCGLFLDGCKIFLSGFTNTESEKLKKIVNAGGATLYTSISDSLSHVVVGEFSLNDAKELAGMVPRPHVVKLEWLVQCIKEKCTVRVEPYVCLQSGPAPPASPLSHKGLKLLKSEGVNDQTMVSTPTNESRAHVSRKLFVKANVVKPSSTIAPLDSPSIDATALEMRALEEMNREKEQLRKENELEQQRKEIEEAKHAKELQRKQQEAERRPVEQSKLLKTDHTNDAANMSDDDQGTMPPFFQDLWFEIIDFFDVEQIQESIELIGGRLVSSPSDPQPDYAIVPIEGTTMKTSAKNVVTIIFVEDCYENGCLITELEYYHRPVYGLTKAIKKLEGVVFGLTGYNRFEKRFIVFVANSLGAIVQDLFSRMDHPEKGVKKSTHLLCKEMSGKKYDAALKWGVPVVSVSWLLDLVEVEGDDVNKTKSPTIDESTANRRSVDLMEEFSQSIPNNAATPTEMNASTTGLHDMTPTDQIMRRSSIPGSAGPPPFYIKTPETPYGKALTGVTPSPQTRKHWAQWIDNFPDHFKGNKTPDNPIPMQRRLSTPLSVIKKQLWTKFGGVRFDGIDPVTAKLLPDGPYGQWASPQGTEVLETDGTSSDQSNIGGAMSATKQKNDDDLQSADLERLSNRIETSQNTFGGSQKWNVIKSSNNISANGPNILWDFENAGIGEKCTSIQNNTTGFKRPAPDSSKSMMDEVSKENVSINHLLAAKCSLDSPKAVSSGANRNEETAERKSIELPPAKVTKENGKQTQVHTSISDARVFLLSGLSMESRSKYENVIRQLGAGITQSPTYDAVTTHIIIEKPIRSEKLLCCIASGKWVLHTSYLDRCYESRDFLPEEEYEWGNPRSAAKLPQLKPGSTEHSLACAAHRWRLKKNDLGSASAFQEMKVVLCTSESKLPQFQRLLEAGGATILPKSNILQANHVIWEEGKIELPIQMAELASRKIHIVPPVYLGEYLVKSTNPIEHYPPTYARFLKHEKRRGFKR